MVQKCENWNEYHQDTVAIPPNPFVDSVIPFAQSMYILELRIALFLMIGLLSRAIDVTDVIVRFLE